MLAKHCILIVDNPISQSPIIHEVAEFHSTKVGTIKFCSIEVCRIDFSISEVGTCKVCFKEFGMTKIHTTEIRVLEVPTFEISHA